MKMLTHTKLQEYHPHCYSKSYNRNQLLYFTRSHLKNSLLQAESFKFTKEPQTVLWVFPPVQIQFYLNDKAWGYLHKEVEIGRIYLNNSEPKAVYCKMEWGESAGVPRAGWE